MLCCTNNDRLSRFLESGVFTVDQQIVQTKLQSQFLEHPVDTGSLHGFTKVSIEENTPSTDHREPQLCLLDQSRFP